MPENSGRKKFRPARDPAGYWYVIPTEREGEWYDLAEAAVDADDMATPDWAVRVGGSPAELTFDGFTIWGKAYP